MGIVPEKKRLLYREIDRAYHRGKDLGVREAENNDTSYEPPATRVHCTIAP